MRRKIVSLTLILAFMLSLMPTVHADTVGKDATINVTGLDFSELSEEVDKLLAEPKPGTHKRDADTLKHLGLFLGTDKGFELDRAPTRTESVILLLRMLGLEQEALDSDYQHPFKDVPTWANKYIGFAYNKGLTVGTSATTFGSNAATPEQFFTFTLRALGYNDKNGDFTYQESINKAVELGLASEGEYTFGSKSFVRGDCASIMYKALSKNLNGDNRRLIDKLVIDGVISKDKAVEVGLIENAPDIISFDTGFYIERGGSASAMAYIVKSELPAVLQNAVYFDLFTTDIDITFDALRDMLKEMNKKGHSGLIDSRIEIDSIDGKDATAVNDGHIACITLHDLNGFIIGARLIKEEEYTSRDPHFIYFDISYPIEYGIPDLANGPNPYLIKRYIDGIEDMSYVQPLGGPRFSDAGYVHYHTPVLFVKDKTVTYEIINLEPSIPKNVTQKIYGE